MGDFFTRADWRPSKRRKLQKRIKPWGGQKTAPPAFLEAAKRTYFQPGRANHRICKATKRDGTPCRMLALHDLHSMQVSRRPRHMGETGEVPPKRQKSRRNSSKASRRNSTPKPQNPSRTYKDPNLPISRPMDKDTVGKCLELPSMANTHPPNPPANRDNQRLRVKAQLALEQLIDNASIPPNVRASAARTLLELVGAIGSKAKADTDQGLNDGEIEPESMSLADIDREIQRLNS